MNAEEIAVLLAEHAGANVTAAWPGSPDPSNWRNIRRVCKCGAVIERGPYRDGPLGGSAFDTTHRAHVAAVLAEREAEVVRAAVDAALAEVERNLLALIGSPGPAAFRIVREARQNGADHG